MSCLVWFDVLFHPVIPGKMTRKTIVIHFILHLETVFEIIWIRYDGSLKPSGNNKKWYARILYCVYLFIVILFTLQLLKSQLVLLPLSFLMHLAFQQFVC